MRWRRERQRLRDEGGGAERGPGWAWRGLGGPRGRAVSESLRPALVPASSWHTWSVPGRQSPWEPFSISARASCSTRPPHPPFPASSQRKSSVALAGSFLPTEGPSRFPQPPDILASPPPSHQSRGLTGQPRRYPFPPSRLAVPLITWGALMALSLGWAGAARAGHQGGRPL